MGGGRSCEFQNAYGKDAKDTMGTKGTKGTRIVMSLDLLLRQHSESGETILTERVPVFSYE